MLCAVTAWGATITVGEGGDHATLSDAVAAAEAGDVVQLVSDLNDTSYVFTKAITVDFNGYTINVSYNYGLQVRTAAVTFTDNSLAKNGGITCGKGCLDVYSKVIINGGTFTSTVTGSGAAIWCNGTAEIEVNDINMNASETGIYAENGRMIINGGNIVADKCVALQMGNGYFEINGGTIISNSSLTNQGRDGGRSYAVISGGTFVMNGGSISGVQGGLALEEDCAGTINNGEIETRHGVDGQHNNHYALYVSTGAVVNVYDGKFKVELPSGGSNRVVSIGDNDAGTTFGIINLYGGLFQQKPYLSHRKAQDAEMIYPASIPLTSQWYSSFGTNVPLPAGYEYYDITEGEDYEAGYRYGVRPVAGKEADAIAPNQKAAQEADPEYTIPWQQASTWAAAEVPEDNTIVTIPKDATVTVSKDETNKDAVADQVFVTQGATLVVEEGTTLTVGDGGVNIGNGGQLIVEKGAVVKVGAAGLITTEEDALVIESSEDEQGIFILDPDVTENTQPKASVKVYTNSKQTSENPWEYTYQRIALPIHELTAAPANDFAGTLFGSETVFENYLFYWNTTNKAWENCLWTAMVPFKGYQLANNSVAGGVTYTFTGNLIGNHDGAYEFSTTGFDFFGNSYTAPIYLKNFLEGFANAGVEAAVWIYDYAGGNYITATPDDFEDDAYPLYLDGVTPFKEIPSMEGFILNLRNNSAGNTASLDYSSSIWNNPRFNSSTPAPKRAAADSNTDRIVISVKASDGKADVLKLNQGAQYSEEFDNGADASKYFAENGINLYATTANGDLSRVATSDLDNTLIGFRSNEATTYTLTIAQQQGEVLVLRDKVTNATIDMTAGVTYTFTQAANTTNPARFEVIRSHKVPTSVDTIENAEKVNGIYTITGQYVGENFTKLPAGVYIVNGTKVIK